MALTTEPLSTDTPDRDAYTAPRLEDLGSLADLTQGGGNEEPDGVDGLSNSSGPM